MRTKVELQRAWPQWFADYAVAQGFSETAYNEAKVLVGKEVSWMIRSGNFEADLATRIAKLNSLLSTYQGTLNSFEPYWRARYDFLNWLQT